MKHRWKPGAKIWQPEWSPNSYLVFTNYIISNNLRKSIAGMYKDKYYTVYSGVHCDKFELYELESL